MNHLQIIAALLLAGQFFGAEDPRMPIPLRLTGETTHRVPAALFGHFLERASWGEPGYETARLPGTRQLDPRAIAVMEAWRVPLIRFPAGTDLSWIDWRDMVDRVPGRAGGRPPFVSGHEHSTGPMSNEFGIDEFLALCRRLGAEPLLPVPLEPGLGAWITPEALALRNAGLVAYCNARPGAQLPAGMPDWGAVRAANGHPEPFGVRRFQLGNEVWAYWDRAMARSGIGDDLDVRYAWYRRVLDASVDAMRAVDPAIELIMEGRPAGRRLAGEKEAVEKRLMVDAALRARVPWITYHDYRPWAITEVRRGEAVVDPATLTPEQAWLAWVAASPAFDAQGQSILKQGLQAGTLGWKVAVTEWNWNGWWQIKDADPPKSLFARGVGAAAWLHALLRRPDIGIACQSMLVGSRWPIAGIFYGADGVPQRMPTGQAVGLYAAQHGDRAVRLERQTVESYVQPLSMGGLRAQERVAYLDAVCTMDDGAWYLHLINRRFDRAERLDLDLAACGALRQSAEHHILEGTLDDSPIAAGSPDCARVRRVEVPVAGPRLMVEVPPRTVSVLVLRRR